MLQKIAVNFSNFAEISMMSRHSSVVQYLETWARILVQVTINRRPRIGRDCHHDQSEVYDLS